MTEKQQHAFLDAARDHVWETVKSMLNQDAGLASCWPLVGACFIRRAAFGSLSICKFLVDKVASLEVLTQDSESSWDAAHLNCKAFLAEAWQHAFLDAAREGKWDMVGSMLAKDSGLVDRQIASRWSALHQAPSSEAWWRASSWSRPTAPRRA